MAVRNSRLIIETSRDPPLKLQALPCAAASNQKNAGTKDRLNVLRKKVAFPDLERAVRDQHRLFNPSVILIENKASGTQLIQQLVEARLSKVTCYKPDGDKIMRLHAQTTRIENGFVHLPREAHSLGDYLHELTVFPNGRHDDQVDSTAQALAWSKQRPQVGACWSIIVSLRKAARDTTIRR